MRGGDFRTGTMLIVDARGYPGPHENGSEGREKVMDEKDREAIALFRYGLIAPVLQGTVEDRAKYIAETAARIHKVPCYGPTEYSPKTIASWISRYTREGFEGLKPRWRSDKGESRAIAKDVRERVIQLREEKRDAPVTVFYELLVEQGVLKPEDVSYSSLYRFLKARHNNADKAGSVEGAEDSGVPWD